jgi:hypothetical protein
MVGASEGKACGRSPSEPAVYHLKAGEIGGNPTGRRIARKPRDTPLSHCRDGLKLMDSQKAIQA